ncbi:obstructor-E-like 7 [Homarus americanus]|uniref:Obstructor-E-like 7 n=1 Tax=Homarus americanus TaxID=6706 RepID=A0A8J5K1N2_HOMAM|nr:obstructor-E-like 7 [Homarus americanus]
MLLRLGCALELLMEAVSYKWSVLVVRMTQKLQRDAMTFVKANAQEFATDCPSPNGFFADSLQCDKYYECIDNVLTEKLCPDGMAFNDINPTVEKCDLLSMVDCAERPDLQIPQPTEFCDRQNGNFAPKDAVNCQDAYRCVNGEGTLISCPVGLAFSLANGICDWPDQSDRTDCNVQNKNNFTCPKVSHEVAVSHPRFADPHDCQYFYVCINGQTPRRNGCAFGQVFNTKTTTSTAESQVPVIELTNEDPMLEPSTAVTDTTPLTQDKQPSYLITSPTAEVTPMPQAAITTTDWGNKYSRNIAGVISNRNENVLYTIVSTTPTVLNSVNQEKPHLSVKHLQFQPVEDRVSADYYKEYFDDYFANLARDPGNIKGDIIAAAIASGYDVPKFRDRVRIQSESKPPTRRGSAAATTFLTPSRTSIDTPVSKPDRREPIRRGPGGGIRRRKKQTTTTSTTTLPPDDYYYYYEEEYPAGSEISSPDVIDPIPAETAASPIDGDALSFGFTASDSAPSQPSSATRTNVPTRRPFGSLGN